MVEVLNQFSKNLLVLMEFYSLLTCNFLISAKDGINKHKKQFQGIRRFDVTVEIFSNIFIQSIKFICIKNEKRRREMLT